MKKCIDCGKWGFLFPLDNNGRCRNCADAHAVAVAAAKKKREAEERHAKWLAEKEAAEERSRQIAAERNAKIEGYYKLFDDLLQIIHISPFEPAAKKVARLPASAASGINFVSMTPSKTRRTYFGDFVVIDTETTGLSAAEDRIIEVAALRFVDFKPVEAFTTLIKTKKEITPKITEITGLTATDLAGAPEFGRVAEPLKVFIGDRPVVGYNLPFDVEFLIRSGVDLAPLSLKYYDVLELAQRIAVRETDNHGGVLNHKLDTLCRAVCIRRPGSGHRALSDCLATGILLYCLIHFRDVWNRKIDFEQIAQCPYWDNFDAL